MLHWIYRFGYARKTIDHVDASVEYAYTGSTMTGVTIALSNGLTFARTFVRDSYRKHKINAVSNCFDSVLIHASDYNHDLLSRRTNIIYKAQTGTNMLSCVYNARSEVTGLTIDTNDYAYIYDNIGNSLYTSLNAITNAFTVNNLNQYKAITNLLDLSGYRLGHDADGNTTRIDDHIPSYDAENRLAAYMFGLSASATGTLRSAYVYDHLGRRVKKMGQECREKDMGGIGNFTYWHTNDVTTFVYDGWNLIHERAAHTNGTVDEIEYVWGLDLSGTLQGAGGVGGLLFEKRNGHIFIPCYDANGNITAYVDTNGIVRASYIFDTLGRTIAQSGDMADVFRFRFSTKYYDEDTELYYYGYRYFSPELGRWINRDPIQEDGGLNLYGFVGNDYVNKYDSLGLKYGMHLSKEEAKQLACALYLWTVDVSVAMPFTRGTTFYRPIALEFLKHFLSKSGAEKTLKYEDLKKDGGVVQANRNAVRYFSGNPSAFKTVISAQVTGEDLGQAIQRMAITYERTGGYLLYAYLATERYTFSDTGFSSRVDVYLPFLEYEGLPCCWKGGGRIHDLWLGDLERYGFAKAFPVRASWHLVAGW